MDTDADADADTEADAWGIAIALLHLSAGALKLSANFLLSSDIYSMSLLQIKEYGDVAYQPHHINLSKPVCTVSYRPP